MADEAVASVMAAHAWLEARQPDRAALHFVQAILNDPRADLGPPEWLDTLRASLPVQMPKIP